MHEHPGGVVVVITGGHLRFTDQNGKVQEVYAKAGEGRWFPAFKDRADNLGDTPYDAVYIKVKGKSSFASSNGTVDDDHKAEMEGIVAEAVSGMGK